MNGNQELVWSAKFETGYENIDTQHKKLFVHAIDLIEACKKNEKVEIKNH